MDCLEIQRLLSDRHGNELVDAHELDLAMDHCEGCPDCRAFSRAMAALDSMPRPVAPDRAVRAALEAVRAERAVVEQASAPAILEEAASPSPEVLSDARRHRGAGRLVAYASAAAVFVGAVFLTVQMMTAGLGEPAALRTDAAAPEFGDAVIVPGEQETAEQDYAASESTPSAAMDAPDYVLVDGVVHIAQRAQVVPFGDITLTGTTRSAQDGPDIRSWNIFEGTDGAQIFMQSAVMGEYWPLSPVVRDWEGSTFALTSELGSLQAFGEWPSLPSSVPEPALADGSPAFSEVGQDVRGTDVYVRSGRTADLGIAIAPGTSRSDPAAGNPNWTWWEPYGD